MKGIVALLTVALCQFASGAHISSCAEEINHTTDLGQAGSLDSDKLTADTDYFLRALVPDYELNAAGFQCAKVTYSKNDKGKKLAKHLAVFSDFTVNTIKEIYAVPAKDVVKDQQGNLVKNVITAYDFLHDDDFYQHEEKLRYPGVTYHRTLFLDNNVFAYWECDRHAVVSETAKDNRFFFTKGKDFAFSKDHEAYSKFDEKPGKDGFEGKLDVLTAEQVARCDSPKFQTNF